jgi:hypothetical protein
MTVRRPKDNPFARLAINKPEGRIVIYTDVEIPPLVAACCGTVGTVKGRHKAPLLRPAEGQQLTEVCCARGRLSLMFEAYSHNKLTRRPRL